MGCADISEIEYINKQIKINIPEPTNISYEDRVDCETNLKN